MSGEQYGASAVAATIPLQMFENSARSLLIDVDSLAKKVHELGLIDLDPSMAMLKQLIKLQIQLQREVLCGHS